MISSYCHLNFLFYRLNLGLQYAFVVIAALMYESKKIEKLFAALYLSPMKLMPARKEIADFCKSRMTFVVEIANWLALLLSDEAKLELGE